MRTAQTSSQVPGALFRCTRCLWLSTVLAQRRKQGYSSKRKIRNRQKEAESSDQLVGTSSDSLCTALWHRDREQPDVRLALRGKAFTQEVRMTSVVEKASGWVAAGHGLYQLHQKNASYPITHTASLVYKTIHLEDTRSQLTWLLCTYFCYIL